MDIEKKKLKWKKRKRKKDKSITEKPNTLQKRRADSAPIGALTAHQIKEDRQKDKKKDTQNKERQQKKT